MKRFLINCTTNWCGEEETFSAFAEEESDLYSIAQELAYDNFNNYPGTGHDGILEDLFPEVEDYEYDDDMHEAAAAVEEHYYSYTIEEWDEERDEEEWNWYELAHDAREVIE